MPDTLSLLELYCCLTGFPVTSIQAVKNTCNASVESKGFCHYKCTNGIKRHLAVDTLGLPFFTHCTRAYVSDDQGLIELLLSESLRLQCKMLT